MRRCVTIALSGVSNAPNNLNQNQAKHGGGIANVQDNGLASLAIQAGAQITGQQGVGDGRRDLEQLRQPAQDGRKRPLEHAEQHRLGLLARSVGRKQGV